MLSYIIRRVVALIPIFLGVSLVVFFTMHIAPGDPARQLVGPLATHEKIVEVRHKLGLDKPIYIQYLTWLSHIVQGDFGQSISSGAPSFELVSGRIGRTLELTVAAFILTIAISLLAGVISAAKHYSVLDTLTTFLALFWVSMPSFWFGLILMLLLAIVLPIFPISGRGGPLWTISGIKHLILPAITLGLPQIAVLMRITRSSVLEVLTQEYINTARSKGLRECIVIFKHVLKNALIPFITMATLQLPWLFGGAVVVETVFAWPGMGRLLVSAVFERDYPLVQCIAMTYTVIVIFANLFADILYCYVDPRIRLE